MSAEFHLRYRLEAWLSGAKPGDVYVYHEGVISSDAASSKAVKVLRDRVSELVEAGEIVVLHEALGGWRYRYRVVRRRCVVMAA